MLHRATFATNAHASHQVCYNMPQYATYAINASHMLQLSHLHYITLQYAPMRYIRYKYAAYATIPYKCATYSSMPYKCTT